MNITLPKFVSYGNYSSSNYGANSLKFTVGNLEVFFSYHTPVAFRNFETGEFYIVKNCWSVTTGKHLNWINPDKSIRISYSEFNKELNRAITT